MQSILKSDYVVFYSCGHQWHEGTYNFLEETLAEFGVTDSTTNHDREKVKRITEGQNFEQEVEELIESWRRNPKMMKFLEDKAKKKEKPLDVVMVEDARWVLKKNKK